MSSIKKTFEIPLDIKREDASRAFHLVEGDNGNILHIILTDNNVPVDLTGAMVNLIVSSRIGIRSQTSDPSVEDNGVTIGGDNHNEVTVDLFNTTYGVGLNEAELQVFSSSDGEEFDTLVTTARFNFDCIRSLVNDETIQSVDQYPILINLINEVQEALRLALPFTSATASAEQGNLADVDITLTDDSITFNFTIPNGVFVGDTTPPADAEVWIIPGGEGGSTEGTIMSTEVYDQDEDGIVDDSEKLGGQLPAYYATASALATEVSNRQSAVSTEVSDRNTAIASAIQTNVTSREGSASGLATLDTNAKVPDAQSSSHVFEIDNDTTLALTHAGGFLNSTAASDIEITVPAYADVAFPIETEIIIYRYNTGGVTITPDTDVTICSSISPINVQRYSAVGLKKISTDVWAIFGA